MHRRKLLWDWTQDNLVIILAYSEPRAIIKLSLTCRKGYDAIRACISLVYSINKRLGHFVSVQDEFRSMQARTGALISGSFALQFFDDTFYPESDLDLYVHSRHAEEVGTWLLQNAYQFVPNEKMDQAPEFSRALLSFYEPEIALPDTTICVPPRDNSEWYRMRGVANVFNFVKTMNRDGRTVVLRIQLITASSTPLEIILNFHSSE